MNFKLEELTKDNEPQYLEQVANLEQAVMANMEARGQSGQLFPTGREDISAYAHSKENTVLLAVDEKGKVVAATYITQGQKPFITTLQNTSSMERTTTSMYEADTKLRQTTWQTC